MKKVLVAGRTHVFMTALQLCLGVVLTLNMSSLSGIEAAGIFGLLWFAIVADGEASSFIGRSVSWEAIRLVPGYNRKIWTTSLCIVGAYVALGMLVSFAIGYLTPPIGITLMIVIGLLALTVRSRRTGNSRLFFGAIAVFFSVFLGIPFSLLFDAPDLHRFLITSISSSAVQIVALALATVATLILKKELDRVTYPKSVVNARSWEHIHPHLAGRIRLFGLPHPSANLLSVFIATIPFFVIVGASHAAFADEGSLLLENRDSVKSVIAATCIYLGTGTAFGSLRNPGMWLAKAWQFGIGNSRVSLSSEYTLRIVATCVVPTVFALGVSVAHAGFVEAPAADWPGYTNFYDEALLLITVNLLCFTWACGAYPKRTTQGPEFLHVRLAMCAVACLIFIFGVDFGLVGRVFLLIALCSSAIVSVYIGGRQLATIDFLPIKQEVNLFSK